MHVHAHLHAQVDVDVLVQRGRIKFLTISDNFPTIGGSKELFMESGVHSHAYIDACTVARAKKKEEEGESLCVRSWGCFFFFLHACIHTFVRACACMRLLAFMPVSGGLCPSALSLTKQRAIVSCVERLVSVFGDKFSGAYHIEIFVASEKNGGFDCFDKVGWLAGLLPSGCGL